METAARRPPLWITLLDPYGDMSQRVAAADPEHRADDVLYLDVPDGRQP